MKKELSSPKGKKTMLNWNNEKSNGNKNYHTTSSGFGKDSHLVSNESFDSNYNLNLSQLIEPKKLAKKTLGMIELDKMVAR